MNTPYEIFRTKSKMRKERLHISVSPKKKSFSLDVTSKPRHPTIKSQSSKGFRPNNKIILKKQDVTNQQNLRNSFQQENYQIIVKNTLKKSSKFKFCYSKSGHLIGDFQKIALNKNDSSCLVIQGSNCGKDLIKLNRKKLEELICKIEGKILPQPSSCLIPQISVEKCKVSRLKVRENSDKVHKHQTSKILSGRLTIDQRRNAKHYKQIYVRKSNLQSETSKTEPLLVSDFLKCSSIYEAKQDENTNDPKGLVLNNSKIFAFIKQSKKQTTNSNRFKQYLNLTASNAQKGTVYYSSREGLNIKSASASASDQIKTQYCSQNLQCRTPQKQKTFPKKAIINGVNFAHLKGWDSPEDHTDVNLMNPSLFQ